MINRKIKFNPICTKLGFLAILYSRSPIGEVNILHSSKPVAEHKDGETILKQWEQQGLYISGKGSTIHAAVISLYTDHTHAD